ncbi:Sucrose nonfermenting 4-like protein [Morus notabilis]|uniref:Sucrose nonfermenting 4-like protein n=1 Tax=Morus notabilis TaxID=981085 RepID=W9RHF9_9ROSA|nr:sucrose nonfermenting 4-like protein [Morus notabilis]EXB74812.1 Sucrose nonfermenting 4-like protein [Morus notabilis]
MFGANMDSGREVGGVPSTVLVPMRFVWPYGGRSVFVSGSFTRWSELIPMSLVEGSSTIFQAIYSVVPGHHQFKFFVDGQWRHDECQPYMSSEYGIVNTLYFATAEPNYNFGSGVPGPNIPGPSMDVDNQAFQNSVRISDGSLTEAVPRISEAELQGSRHRIAMFLSSHTVYELMPESGKVFTLSVDLPVKQAFHILHEQGFPLAPLWDDARGQLVGILSVMDFILILRELGNHGSNLTEEELETHTISAWKEGKAYLNGQIDGHGRALRRRLIHAGPHDNLKDLALKILQNEVATVPVIRSSFEVGSYPQLLYLASLSGILKCICRYFKHCSSSLPILQLPIGAIPVGTWVPKIGEANQRPFAMLRPSASLSSALNLLVQAQVSSIPIVDDNDSLLDIYCRSDITALAKDRAYTHINLNEMTIHQALQFGQDSYSPFEPKSQRCQMCLRSDSLHKVMERLANPGVRRLVIVEAGSKRVEGIVSLSDIFKFLLG